MKRTFYFVSHPEVVISPTIPVTQWPLSKTGRLRMKQLLLADWITRISAIYCSDEQKAIDGAEILANHVNLGYTQLKGLGENDRSSTGFLEPAEFEATADRFFSSPESSIRGWETAKDAQHRIVGTIEQIDREDTTSGVIAVVSHGAVGTLLYCHLTGNMIDRRWDQPGNGGGNYMKIQGQPTPTCSWWKPID